MASQVRRRWEQSDCTAVQGRLKCVPPPPVEKCATPDGVIPPAEPRRRRDGDGYGDETQDACPSDASTQGACPPPPPTPETSITKSPKKVVMTKGRRAEVKFAFTSSEANSPFRCVMDGSRAKACSSPFKTKVRRGKHRFAGDRRLELVAIPLQLPSKLADAFLRGRR